MLPSNCSCPSLAPIKEGMESLVADKKLLLQPTLMLRFTWESVSFSAKFESLYLIERFYNAEAEYLKANSLKSKIFGFDMAISSILYVLQFILIDFNDNHPHYGIITVYCLL